MKLRGKKKYKYWYVTVQVSGHAQYIQGGSNFSSEVIGRSWVTVIRKAWRQQLLRGVEDRGALRLRAGSGRE